MLCSPPHQTLVQNLSTHACDARAAMGSVCTPMDVDERSDPKNSTNCKQVIRQPQNTNQKPRTPNTKHQTPNTKHQTPNIKSASKLHHAHSCPFQLFSSPYFDQRITLREIFYDFGVFLCAAPASHLLLASRVVGVEGSLFACRFQVFFRVLDDGNGKRAGVCHATRTLPKCFTALPPLSQGYGDVFPLGWCARALNTLHMFLSWVPSPPPPPPPPL